MASPRLHSTLLLVIVGKGDALLYEANLGPAAKREDVTATASDQFRCLAAIEPTELLLWQQQQMYCKVVDRTGKLCVSAFVGANYTKLLLLHRPPKSDENIRLFFQDLYELVVKMQLNPLYGYNGVLYSAAFERRVYALSAKYLQQ
eukprot:Gregarina_sp_Poly_1__7303@NODE_400_length_8891_cov_119_104941_g317_i1_p5_GENE_NODE_400_length_8891_cov_119_104941_g317_i1NODE_400_length_8891_cov_119_104941_g317_i1_p5_ORF_typecomplete_len146_score17_02Sedlin_N/PF04628_13/4_6e24_NODE_400_length_8891_cov_119_104941_g317_i168777314